jgi:hypothetical protein
MMRGLLPAALAALCGLPLPALAQSETQSAIDARVARCVLDNIALARGRGSADLIAEACRALIQNAGADAQDGSITLVKCVVPGDPEWVEFRLLTRSQCADAAGIVGG